MTSHPIRTQIQKFVPLDDEAWALMEPHITEKQLARNDLLVQEGKLARELGLVLEGNFRQYYTRDGEEKTTYFFFENHFIGGYMSCVSGQPSLLNIEALTPARVAMFPYAVLQELYHRSHLWERFGRMLAEYLGMGLEERMVDLLLLTAEERYLKLQNGNKQKILERIPQHYIANYLGITPVSLSRIRAGISKNKLE
jgi:CRP-like cAMP-binding protein